MNPAFPIFSQLNSTLWLLTVTTPGARGGMIVTFVHTASIVPDCPRVVVGIAKQHYTWKLIESSNRFVLHLFGEKQFEWVHRFGLQCGRDVDKLAGLAQTTTPGGQQFLNDAQAWMDCRVEARMDSGDKTIYLADVETGELPGNDPPLTAKRMVELAPPEMLAELKARMETDIEIDEQAILRWREENIG